MKWEVARPRPPWHHMHACIQYLCGAGGVPLTIAPSALPYRDIHPVICEVLWDYLFIILMQMTSSNSAKIAGKLVTKHLS